MSMFSITSCSVASPRATVCSNGYRFTHTRSTGSISCSAAARRCSSSSRSASRPAYRRGCSVLTRPSSISGKPVKSSIARTGRPASASARAVPPVETISTPSSARPRAKSTIPSFSDTDSSARRTRTSPGAAGSTPAALEVARLPPAPICREPTRAGGARPRRAPRRASPRVGAVAAQRAGRDQAHRLGQQLVLERAQRREHLAGVGGVGQLHGALQDHGPAVDARVDEVDGHAEHLDAVVERLLDRAEPGEGGQQRGMHVDHRAREAREEGLPEQLHVAGEHDQARAARGKPLRQRLVALVAAGVVGAREHGRRHVARAGTLERRGVGDVRGDRHDLRLAAVDGVEQRLQVGAGA